jgi:hypothetical protein
MGEMMGAITGGSATPIASADLKTMLPESVGDLKRTGIEASSGQAMGIAGSSAKATYSAGERRLDLSITDTGGLAGLATMAGWANMTMDKETDGKVEKVYKDGARTGARGVPEGRQPRRGDRDPLQRRDRRGQRQQGRRRDLEEGARRPRPGRIEAMKRPAK